MKNEWNYWTKILGLTLILKIYENIAQYSQTLSFKQILEFDDTWHHVKNVLIWFNFGVKDYNI